MIRNKVQLGQRYGLLTVVAKSNKGTTKNHRYECVCDCGNRTLVWVSGLTSKAEPIRSCGCLISLAARRPPGQAGNNWLFIRCKKNAEFRGIHFLISKEHHKEIASRDCFYCGSPPKRCNPYVKIDGTLNARRSQEIVDRAWVVANGIDRTDSTLGYTLENCVAACGQCNYSKLDYTKDEFIEHAYAIVAHQEKLKLSDNVFSIQGATNVKRTTDSNNDDSAA